MNKVISTNIHGAKRLTLNLFLIVPFVCLLAEFSTYYIIRHSDVYINLICIGIFILYGSGLIDRKYVTPVVKYGFLSFLALLIPVFFFQESPYVKLVYQLFYALCFAVLKSHYKRYVYEHFTLWLSAVFLLGIIEYFLWIIGFRHPIDEVVRDNGDMFFQNFLSLVPTYASGGTPFRFMSLCEEPGMVGTLCVFLLATINRKEHPYQFFIFLLSGIISLSLAFYVLAAIWFVFNIKEIGLSLKSVLIVIVCMTFLFTIFSEAFNIDIVDRLSVNRIEDVDNRSSYIENKKFVELSKSERILVGMGPRTFEDWSSRNGAYGAGVKKFILQNGLITLIIIIYAFSKIIIDLNGVSKKTILLLVLIWLSFYQRHDWNFAPNIILLFSMSSVGLGQIQSKLKIIEN